MSDPNSGSTARPGSVKPDAEMIDALVALGIDEASALHAVEHGDVPFVLIADQLGEEHPYTLDEIAERAEIDLDLLQRIFLALGLPPQDRYSEGDLRAAEQLSELHDVFGTDALIRLARVRGISVSRIAMGDLNAVRDELVSPLRSSGADDLTIAVRLAEESTELLRVATDLLVHAYRRSLVHVLSSEIVRLAARESGQEIDLAVGFVDLVGYTALSARIDPLGLDEVLDAFEQRVLDVVGGRTDVTLVKFLGDAAMLVSADPVPLAAALLELVEPQEELEDAPMRAGMAAGPTLVREGDYYGPVVNLAARLTDRARAWRLLADDELDDLLSEAYKVDRIRPMRIRGVGLRRPIAVRHAE